MSFDLELAKGDLKIGADKDLSKVRNGSKLGQDVLKILFTPLGSDPFFTIKGNALTQQNIGEVVNKQFLEARAAASIKETLLSLQTIQSNQAKLQEVTLEETLKSIEEVSVEQDPLDARQYNISLTILTGAYTTIDLPNFSLSVGIDS
jgi:superfamily II helicase